MAKKKEKEKQFLSLTAYARHRGVTHRAVQKAVQNGRIAPDQITGKFDPEVCDLAWELGSNPAKQRKKVPVERVVKHADKYAQAKAEREDYTARLQRLSYEQKAKILIEAAAVQSRLFENARAVRDAILNLPNRIAPELAAETDPVKVANFLTIELNKVLEELAAPRAAAAQAGASSLGPAPDPEQEEEEVEDPELEGMPVEAPR